MAADHARLQLCIHAIGDAGISQILDLFDDIVRGNGERDRRFRIEHAQHIAPKDFDRFATLKVIASVQPYHAIDDGRWAERRIGPERIKTTYAFRTLLDKGVRARARHRLVGRAAQPDADALCRDDARDARRQESGRLGPGAEDHDRRGGRRVHQRLGVRRVPGSARRARSRAASSRTS